MATLTPALSVPALSLKARVDEIEYVNLIDLFPAQRRIVIIAPHPDDEVLGCGGILAGLAEQQRNLFLIVVTNGEACYPKSAVSESDMATIRSAEMLIALRRLGITAITLTRLGLPDGKVKKEAARLQENLLALLLPDDIVITTWRHDNHCDHAEIGHICATITPIVGAQLIELPIWMGHAENDRLIPWYAAKRIRLHSDWLQRKRRALAAYHSQLNAPAGFHGAPILTKALLPRWLQPWEMVFI